MGNERGTTVQFHFILNQTVADEECIPHLEEKLRTTAREHLIWREDHPDRGVVKIWYDRLESPVQPLGIYLTVTGIEPLTEEKGQALREALERCFSDVKGE